MIIVPVNSKWSLRAWGVELKCNGVVLRTWPALLAAPMRAPSHRASGHAIPSL